jgi:hypothetical protein
MWVEPTKLQDISCFVVQHSDFAMWLICVLQWSHIQGTVKTMEHIPNIVQNLDCRIMKCPILELCTVDTVSLFF